MTTNDSKAPLRLVKRVQFGILSPDEIVCIECLFLCVNAYEMMIFSNFSVECL